MHIIENETLLIKARNMGAELISVFDKQTGTEHLWQADEKFWGWHAPVLFPVVGRCLNDKIKIEEKEYQMEKHGFARKADFKLMELSGQRMVFSLMWNTQTYKMYPYRFEFLVGYTLHQNKLITTYEVVNEDDKPVYFSVGGHPAFAVPFNKGEDYSDYYLEFEHPETSKRHLINDEGFFDGRIEEVFNHSSVIKLTNDLFQGDALIFKDLQSSKVSIKSNLHSQKLSVEFNDFNYLGIWAKVGAPFVCIEPWLGCADTAGTPLNYEDKEEVMNLSAGNRFSVSFTILVG